MPLLPLAPNLDDRTFQDLVDEAKRLIPRYCPEWTDHNVSDPGIALIELFAYLTESMIFRLNHVPDKTHITFLDTIGVRLAPPQAAVADLTFLLSAPQPAPVRIPAETEVATVRTPDWETLTFATTETLTIEPPVLSALLTSADGARYTERRDRLVAEGLPFDAFDRDPNPGNAWYLGFGADLSRHVVRLTVRADQGTGPNPDDTPLAWEGWLGEDRGWVGVETEADSTRGLLKGGSIELYLPPALAGATLGDRRARSWIRAVLTTPRSGQYPYDRSPRILAVEAQAIGGTAAARHAERVRREALGHSDGTPGQRVTLRRSPILPRRDGQFLEVGDRDGGWHAWTEVRDFALSGPDDPHYLCDEATGIVEFGPAVRAPDGALVQHGAVPPKGAPLRFSAYHVGGGTAGNVAAHRLVVLKSSLAYVARVANRRPATGGADVETLSHAKLRAGATLRTRDRAVTADDFETLARRASSAVAQARCLDPTALGTGRNAPKPGTVVVAILPVIADPERAVEPDELRPSSDLLETVRAFLDERRLVTTQVDVRPARVLRIAVTANVAAQVPAQTEALRAAVERAIYRLLNPILGGPDGDGGWPFGRDLSVYDVHAAIQSVLGVGLIDDVRLTVLDDRGRGRDGGSRVPVPADTTVASGPHVVTIASRRR